MEFLLLVVLLLVAMTWAWTLYLVWSLSVSEDQDPLSVPASETQLVGSRQFEDGELVRLMRATDEEQRRKDLYAGMVENGVYRKESPQAEADEPSIPRRVPKGLGDCLSAQESDAPRPSTRWMDEYFAAQKSSAPRPSTKWMDHYFSVLDSSLSRLPIDPQDPTPALSSASKPAPHEATAGLDQNSRPELGQGANDAC